MKREVRRPHWPLSVIIAETFEAVVVGGMIGLLLGFAIVHFLDRGPKPLQVEYTLDRGPTVWR